MALIKCHECGGDVSTDAERCPKCGVAPKKKASAIVKFGGGFIAVMMAIAVLGFLFSDPKPSEAGRFSEQVPQAAEVNADAQKASCKKDLQCWGDKGVGTAGVYCRDQIEKLATHSMRWTDRFLEPKFSHFRWLDKDRATVTFSGDKAEFQNGFGAYTTVTYECDFDQESNQVLDVRAREGRL